MTQDFRQNLIGRMMPAIDAAVSSPKDADKPAPYTLGQQAVIEGLIECQKHLGISDKGFAKGYLKTYTESTWNRLRNNSYGARDLTKTFTELARLLAGIRRRIARQVSATQHSKYHELDQFTALFQAVEECLLKRGQNRLIVHAAPTGAGKSRFIAELGARTEVAAVNANETWYSSYFAAASDMLLALGYTRPCNSAYEARKALMEQMKDSVEVIAIDEGNYFGPRSINLVKDILNDTGWTVLVSLTPAAWVRMQRHTHEFGQLQRRLHAVYASDTKGIVSVREVIPFLVDAGLNGDSKRAAIALAAAANEFGAFDLIHRVTERVADTVVKGHPTLEDVESAIAYVKALMGRVK